MLIVSYSTKDENKLSIYIYLVCVKMFVPSSQSNVRMMYLNYYFVWAMKFQMHA